MGKRAKTFVEDCILADKLYIDELVTPYFYNRGKFDCINDCNNSYS